MVKVIIGNIFDSKAQTLVNTVNCVGVMGKGIAQEFRKRFDEMYKEYVSLCKSGYVRPGVPYHYKNIFGVSIVNFPTKDHWRAMSLLNYVEKGLDIFSEKYQDWGITSVAFPPLGCGNGGLEWETVGPIMYRKLKKLNITVEIYAPYGTPEKYLTETFLSGTTSNDSKSEIGHKLLKFRPEWVAALEVLHNLEVQPYVKPVGRTIFQKICYVMQEQGIDLGFKFGQGSYGPYSEELKTALKVMANNNLVFETQLGKMTALKIGTEYGSLRKKYGDVIQQFAEEINKATDLFMRVKDTEQAEEVTTVLFIIKKLKKHKCVVSEKDIYNEILVWKKHWDKPDKKKSVAFAIRNLGMLRWIEADFSDTLDVKDL